MENAPSHSYTSDWDTTLSEYNAVFPASERAQDVRMDEPAAKRARLSMEDVLMELENENIR